MSKFATPASLFCAVALALSASASAQEMVPPTDPVPDPALQAELNADPGFDELDKDMDGFISKEDLPPEHSLALEFAAADSNRDSRLDRVEFDAYVDEPEEEEAEE
ncbi:hypothetical protein GCM10011521_23000 [Arenimonas soli]|uniref:EF-hand domain-containing protein n=1 Tax=Arenimonas soli TaxID=2269504 RepID=A0ABQ1HPM2_9GAMM|nr:hypothetical protein [Arenimonas soli]GGA84033.1 hypothetical protein GCM10011521_23000 [Arenimonas soli]